MKVLVTGGTGVVGTGAIPALLRAGHEVRLLSRHADTDVSSFPAGVESFAADLASSTDLGRALEGCACVLHIAGIVEEEPPEVTFEQVNVEGTRRLLTAARAAGSPRFLYLSSLGAERGASEYHQSKRRAEELVRGYDGEWVILRPGSVYGPGDETVSTLLKMVRMLPAIPVVEAGDQPFQPLWYADLAQALAQAVDQPGVVGQTLELAGPDTTSTNDLLKRLSAITGLERPRLSVPAWLTEIGVQALDGFGAVGKRLLRRAGMNTPISAATLTMLLEGNVIAEPGANALATVFGVTPTSLDDGLQMLTALLPEQLPGDGVGAVKQETYSVQIIGSRYSVEALLDQVCERIQDVMPMEFSAEPGAPTRAEPGSTLTADVPLRGHIQVRLEERTPMRATFVTIEGHPLAGVVQLHAEDLAGSVRFNVHIAAQPANVVDWIAMRTLGSTMQQTNWREVLRRVVKLSGGNAPAGVEHESHAMEAAEARDIRRFAERIVQAQRRERLEADVAQKSCGM
jgi:uncharacterized protein YbjT (DUF2867 family)